MGEPAVGQIGAFHCLRWLYCTVMGQFRRSAAMAGVRHSGTGRVTGRDDAVGVADTYRRSGGSARGFLWRSGSYLAVAGIALIPIAAATEPAAVDSGSLPAVSPPDLPPPAQLLPDLLEKGPEVEGFDEFLARVLLHRSYLKDEFDNDPLRQRLSDFTIEAARRIEHLEAREAKREALRYAGLMNKYLPDTLWRVGYRARNGEAGAQLALGAIYRWGIIDDADPALSCSNYALAASVGQRYAQYRHAICLVDSDAAAAKGALRVAAENGHAGAQELMGRLCLEAEPRDSLCAQDFLARAARPTDVCGRGAAGRSVRLE